MCLYTVMLQIYVSDVIVQKQIICILKSVSMRVFVDVHSLVSGFSHEHEYLASGYIFGEMRAFILLREMY